MDEDLLLCILYSSRFPNDTGVSTLHFYVKFVCTQWHFINTPIRSYFILFLLCHICTDFVNDCRRTG